jgi:hypothetical protein
MTRAAVRKHALPTVLVALAAAWLVCPEWPDPGKDGPIVVVRRQQSAPTTAAAVPAQPLLPPPTAKPEIPSYAARWVCVLLQNYELTKSRSWRPPDPPPPRVRVTVYLEKDSTAGERELAEQVKRMLEELQRENPGREATFARHVGDELTWQNFPGHCYCGWVGT